MSVTLINDADSLVAVTAPEATAARRGRPPRSEDELRRRRLDISRAAASLFREVGLAAAGGRQLAEAAGVSESTLWRLFRGKEALVEPLLAAAIEDFRAVLRSWPPDVDLADHLQAAYEVGSAASRTDTDLMLAVVRLSRDEPGLRAVWLMLQERAEPTFAEVLAPRSGLPVDAPEVRVHAATVNAVLRVTVDEVAWAAVDDADPAATARHHERLARSLRAVSGRGVAPTASD